MNLSRRSFLKVAGLTTVAAAGAVMFSGCVAASYFQISNSDKSMQGEMSDAEYQAQLDKVNATLKALVIPFVSKIKVEDVQKYIDQALSQSGVEVPEGQGIKINSKSEDGYIYAEGNGIGCITIDISIVKTAA